MIKNNTYDKWYPYIFLEILIWIVSFLSIYKMAFFLAFYIIIKIMLSFHFKKNILYIYNSIFSLITFWFWWFIYAGISNNILILTSVVILMLTNLVTILYVLDLDILDR